MAATLRGLGGEMMQRCWYWTENQPAWARCSGNGFVQTAIRMFDGEVIRICQRHHDDLRKQLSAMGYKLSREKVPIELVFG